MSGAKAFITNQSRLLLAGDIGQIEYMKSIISAGVESDEKQVILAAHEASRLRKCYACRLSPDEPFVENDELCVGVMEDLLGDYQAALIWVHKTQEEIRKADHL